MFRLSSFAAVTLCSCAIAVVAFAQETDGGVTATLEVVESLRFSDNPDLQINSSGNEFRSNTGLTFGLESITQVQTFRFTAGTELELGEGNSAANGFTDPRVGLFFSRESRNAAVSFDVDYRQSDIGQTVETDTVTNQDLIFDNGTRHALNAELEFQVGREAPVGLTFRSFLRTREFTGSTNTSLFDSKDRGLSVTGRFNITPTVTASLSALYQDFDAEGTQTDRVTQSVSAEVSVDVNARLTTALRVSQQRVEVTEFITGSPVVRVEEGAGIRLSADQDMLNGSLSASIGSNVSATGRRYNARVRRDFVLPQGDLSLTAGLSKSDGFSANPLYAIKYTRDLRNGALSVNFNQAVNTSASSEEAVESQLRIGYSDELTALSSWSANFSVQDVNFVGSSSSADTRRYDLNASYRRELAQDWDMVSGYRYSQLETSGTADRTSNTVFFNIERQFTFRP